MSYEPKWSRIWARLSWLDLVWSCAAFLPLSCGRMGGLVAQLLKYSRKDTRGTPAVSHIFIIFVSFTGAGGRGRLCRVPGVNSASHTCWTLEAAYLNGCFQLWRGRRLNVALHFIQVIFFFKHFPLFSCPQAHILTWTCQRNTSMSSLMWFKHIFFLFLNQWLCILVGLHHVCPGQGDTVGLFV